MKIVALREINVVLATCWGTTPQCPNALGYTECIADPSAVIQAY